MFNVFHHYISSSLGKTLKHRFLLVVDLKFILVQFIKARVLAIYQMSRFIYHVWRFHSASLCTSIYNTHPQVSYNVRPPR